MAVGLPDLAPAIQMQARRIAPPLLAQIVVTIFRCLPDRESHIVQLDVRIAATAADVEHEQLQETRACFYGHPNDGGRI
jgi:hypothetical protein